MAIKLTEKQKALIASTPQDNEENVAISVRNLTISFHTDNGKVQAVRGVSFDLYRGETLCIVGESGSGKSVTSKAIMGILSRNAIVEGGQIIYEGEDLLKVSEEEFHRIRGHKIGMIFQDPLSSLNPIVRIGKQIIEAMMINSNQLKNHYQELISDELTAYKNAKNERDADIAVAEARLATFESELKEEENKLLAKLNEAKAELRAGKKNGGDVSSLEAKVSSLKEALDTLKKEDKAKIDERRAEVKRISEEARAKYKAVAPGLKEALKKRKAEARVENEAYAQQLIEERDDKLIELAEERAEYSLSEKDQARLDELEAIIKQKEAVLRRKTIAVYFLSKIKRKMIEAAEAELAPLRRERNELAKQLDEFDARERAILDDYQFHTRITKRLAKRKALSVMAEVGIPQPEKRFRQFPFQFSGGMRQRIVIAIALIAEPDILICDEPTTALDVTIQAQILELINRLKAAHNMSVIFITHDLGVVANMSDRVAVMYAGKIVEYGTDKEVFFDPRHPYTWALLSSIPDIDSKEKLEAIPGTPPDMIYPPVGDAFAERNRYALGVDFKYQPPLFKISDTHYAATWLEYEGAPDVEPPAIVTTRVLHALDEEEAKKHG